jgi:hypothetical protein
MARKLFVQAGQRFGRGVVIDPEAGKTGDRHYLARLRCDCGTEYEARLAFLVRGQVVSCGCRQREGAPRGTGQRLSVTAGQRFGRGTVTDPEAGRARGGRARCARLRCDCGTEYEARLTDLLRGVIRSCGCLHREISGQHIRAYIGPDGPGAQALRQWWAVPRGGTDREPFSAPDPDWCDRHGVSFWDHTASQRRQSCYREVVRGASRQARGNEPGRASKPRARAPRLEP